ncbi:hypothetical protein [Sinorhizobium alkalisoli]|uniref:hypothetical protein n=1 Tax=Sinorhizobium alkalisoli TaxID=1752398 RepID=UPI001042252B|nr:hypothetical protein [Sinorhizobium alkalisoli]
MTYALLFTANSPHVVQAGLMLSSLRDKDRGNFSGDIWVLSTGLSESVKRYLDDINVKYFEDGLAWAYQAIDWRAIAEMNPSVNAEVGFSLFRDKRMSKLVFLEWFERHGRDYSVVAVADNDLYFQREINYIFAVGNNGKINYGEEDNLILPGTSIWYKDFHYKRLTGDWSYDGGSRESNIGFVVAKPESMKEMFEFVKNGLQDLPIELIRDFKWHDQDLVRLFRSQRPDQFQKFDSSVILHLCGGGMSRVRATSSDIFLDGVTGELPAVIHFGGGAWAEFPNIARSFRVPPAHFLFKYESEAVQAKVIDEFQRRVSIERKKQDGA